MKSNVVFVKFHMWLRSADFVVVLVVVLVLVLVPRPLYNSDFEHEDEDEYEYEKNPIRSSTYAPAIAG